MMTTQEIITAALVLTKKDRTAIINALLASMSDKTTDRKMPTAAAMKVFEDVYAKYKGCAFGIMTPLQFSALRQLLLKIESRMQESGIDLITDTVLVQNFEAFLRKVALMQNRWYFENRFTPEALNRDFDKIYANLRQQNPDSIANSAYDCL